ncbi:hypothetical protein [Chamaesiphon sp. OTE_75_metabat_556]|uniref:hypothetical protein n=1 Tax=Chamaesiphon sp. OTE_75_metabat_556 TaxID=2964692 RepID=UPI00286A68E6|nr:hypothetical protein [Chamaesiphon sp. OTE_75_metabat_556]
MSYQNVIDFFKACDHDVALLEQFELRSLAELLLHANTLGYRFSSRELSAVIGSMETKLIVEKMGEEIAASSSLWRRMWGKSRLKYAVEELFKSFSQSELEQLLSSLA